MDQELDLVITRPLWSRTVTGITSTTRQCWPQTKTRSPIPRLTFCSTSSENSKRPKCRRRRPRRHQRNLIKSAASHSTSKTATTAEILKSQLLHTAPQKQLQRLRLQVSCSIQHLKISYNGWDVHNQLRLLLSISFLGTWLPLNTTTYLCILFYYVFSTLLWSYHIVLFLNFAALLLFLKEAKNSACLIQKWPQTCTCRRVLEVFMMSALIYSWWILGTERNPRVCCKLVGSAESVKNRTSIANRF